MTPRPTSSTQNVMKRCVCLAAFVVFLCENPASATPILYDESVDGDLPGLELTLLLLGTGPNIVRGETTIAFSPHFDIDSFMFVVPSGTRLVSGRVDLEDSVGDMVEVHWSFQDGPFGDISLLESLTPSSPGSATFKTTPRGSGTYYVIGGGFVFDNDLASSSYEFRLEVSAVPEPASSFLMWLGIASALSFRRRRSSRLSSARA